MHEANIQVLERKLIYFQHSKRREGRSPTSSRALNRQKKQNHSKDENSRQRKSRSSLNRYSNRIVSSLKTKLI